MPQFINPKDFDPSCLIIGSAVSQSNGSHRCTIKYKFADGNIGPLLLCTPKLFSFGVSPQSPIGETVKEDLSNVNGFVLPLCLCDSSNIIKPEEQDLISVIDSLPNVLVKHCTTPEFNAELGKYGEEQYTASDLKKINPIYRKKEKGVIVPGKSPMLYPKLKRKGDLFVTIFNKNDNSYTPDTDVSVENVNPIELLNVKMNTKCQLHIESIFIGAKISLQLKLIQVLYEPIQTTQHRIPGF